MAKFGITKHEARYLAQCLVNYKLLFRKASWLGSWVSHLSINSCCESLVTEKTGLNTTFVLRPTGFPLTPKRQSQYQLYPLQNIDTSYCLLLVLLFSPLKLKNSLDLTFCSLFILYTSVCIMGRHGSRASATTEMNMIKSGTAWKGGAEVEVASLQGKKKE